VIQCDICFAWHHVECVGLRVDEVETIGKYHCPRCAPMCGPSTVKAAAASDRRRGAGRTRPPPVPPSPDELCALRTPAALTELLCRHRADQFDDDTLDREGFQKPILLTHSGESVVSLPCFCLQYANGLILQTSPRCPLLTAAWPN
jgi:hypothetical protein